MLDDALRDFEIALAEGTGRVVHRGSAEMLGDRIGPAPALEMRAEYDVGAIAVRVEPQAVQLMAKLLADQLEAARERLRRLAVSHQHDLRRLRAALHDHLQIARKAQVCLIRIAGDARLDERTAHDAGDAVDERMLHSAARNVHHTVGTELEQSELGRAEASANREPRAMSKAEHRTGHDCRIRKAMVASEIAEGRAHEGIDAGLSEPGTTRARRPMRAVHDCLVEHA